ncbi:hypothetical protein P3T18_006615 [Paraburkholderia sp. GAS199]|uniref:hypothetical protein n=1 Tax=Paraburkholderia sp. GAS199 TaxID=3035126 RepID=UPI003D227FB1
MISLRHSSSFGAGFVLAALALPAAAFAGSALHDTGTGGIVRVRYDTGVVVTSRVINAASNHQSVEDFHSTEAVPSFRFCRNRPDWNGRCDAARESFEEVELESRCTGRVPAGGFPSAPGLDTGQHQHHAAFDNIAQ